MTDTPSPTLYYGYPKEIHDRAMRYIENDIWARQTSLILDAFGRLDDIGGIHVDSIHNLYVVPEDEDEDIEQQEIYEWYLVSEWMAKKLDAQGEPVLYGDYNYYWGRTCTGQAIILDGTFQKIAQAIEQSYL